MIEGAVVFDIQTDVVHIVVLHRLVVPQHQDGHGGRMIDLAAGEAVPQPGHAHAHPVLHLDAVEIVDDAVFYIIVTADDVAPVAATQFYRPGTQVVQFAAGKSATAASGVNTRRDVAHSMNTATLDTAIQTI